MNTRVLLSLSAVVMSVLGTAGLFLPHEILTALAIAPTGAAPLLVQLLAALLFAFGLVNWTSRGSLIGGICNRPVAMGNLAHFIIGALALTKAALSGQRHPAILALTAIYIVFAIGFATLRGPKARA